MGLRNPSQFDDRFYNLLDQQNSQQVRNQQVAEEAQRQSTLAQGQAIGDSFSKAEEGFGYGQQIAHRQQAAQQAQAQSDARLRMSDIAEEQGGQQVEETNAKLDQAREYQDWLHSPAGKAAGGGSAAQAPSTPQYGAGAQGAPGAQPAPGPTNQQQLWGAQMQNDLLTPQVTKQNIAASQSGVAANRAVMGINAAQEGRAKLGFGQSFVDQLYANPNSPPTDEQKAYVDTALKNMGHNEDSIAAMHANAASKQSMAASLAAANNPYYQKGVAKWSEASDQALTNDMNTRQLMQDLSILKKYPRGLGTTQAEKDAISDAQVRFKAMGRGDLANSIDLKNGLLTRGVDSITGSYGQEPITRAGLLSNYIQDSVDRSTENLNSYVKNAAINDGQRADLQQKIRNLQAHKSKLSGVLSNPQNLNPQMAGNPPPQQAAAQPASFQPGPNQKTYRGGGAQ